MTAFIPLLAQGTLTTLILWISASILSVIIGVTLGTVRCNQIRVPIIAQLGDGATLILRGIPLYAQLMIAYFVLPQLTGISLSAFTTGIITLGVCSGAYTSEIIRGSIHSISPGQWKAAQVLGYTTWQQLRFIIFPQVFTQALPALINEYSMAMKSTAILASIGTLELTKVGMNIMYRSFNPLEVCFSIAAIYLALSTVLTIFGTYLERRTYAQRQ